MKHGIQVGSRLELARVDKTENAARFYRLEVAKPSQLGLFETGIGVVLVRAWGRLGNPPQTKRETFLTLEDLAKQWRRVLRTREAHGYHVTRETRPTSYSSPRGRKATKASRTAGDTGPTGPNAKRRRTLSGSGDAKGSGE